MSQRIWKRVNDETIGFGNGYRAHVYETPGFAELNIETIWTVLVHDCHKRVAKHIDKSESAVKRWAEKNYLKGNK